MNIDDAAEKAGPFGIAREEHRELERRAVFLNGSWVNVDGDEVDAIIPTPQEDLDAEDWFVVRGDEWKMAEIVRAG
jgi:hypothetical protein